MKKCLQVRGVSEQAVCRVWNTASELREGPVVSNVARVAAEHLLPHAQCYDWHVLPAVKGPDLEVGVLNLHRALRHAVGNSKEWASALQTAHLLPRPVPSSPID